MLVNTRKVLLLYSPSKCLRQARLLSLSTTTNKNYELVVVGGGSGGCATGAKFASKLGKGKVAIIEPAEMHYYQPMWTLVGGGIKKFEESGRPMSQVLPKNADWIKQKVVSFKPDENKVVTDDGKEIGYQYLVVAMGLQLNYKKIKGLPDAFETPGVCSNYSPLYVRKTLECLNNFKKGNAIFTMPPMPIKCAGAPQKIMYIGEEVFRTNGTRDNAKVLYTSALGVIFGVKKYADSLWKVVKSRDIEVKLKHNLIEIKPDSKEAVYEMVDNPSETVTIPYEMIHITPPMSSPDILREAKSITDQAGFLDVDKHTLQHNKYKNIFGVGDCTSCPTSKTAASAAAQFGVMHRNLTKVMEGKGLKSSYDGYTSCPLVTSSSKCILAEFDYDANPLETFPIDQGKESRLMYHMKKDMMPHMYWQGMCKGLWEGPKMMRKILHLGIGK